MDFSAPYKGNFDMKLDFSMLSSNDFKFGHKLKHLEFNRTIEDGNLNVVENITRVIMIFYFFQYLSVEKLSYLFVQTAMSISLWFKSYTYHEYCLKIYAYSLL